jgi:predicted ArsR family transcriptional regulator
MLVGKAPQGVTELVRQTGVTRTAVVEQLNELMEAGFVERTCQRLPGRGRPRHVYSATDAALLLLFVGNQRLLVPSIWQAVYEVGGERLKQQVLDRVSLEMAEHYKRQIDGRTPAERLRQFSEVLAQQGDVVEIDEKADGRLVLSKRSCGFYSMFEPSRVVCCVDEAMTSRVVGAPVVRTACRHDGAPCCRFELVSADQMDDVPQQAKTARE